MTKGAKDEKELQEGLCKAMDAMMEILEDEGSTENQKSQAANAYKGLYREYIEKYGEESDEVNPNMKKVKNF